MRRTALAALGAVLVSMTFLIGAPAAMATTTCPPDPAAGSTISDSIVVNSGTCTLTSVTVQGGVTVNPGATLITKDSTIAGNVSVSTGAVKLEGGSVGGSVVLTNAPSFRICNIPIAVDLVIQNRTTAPTTSLPPCTEAGGVPVSGSVFIRDNALGVSGGGFTAGYVVITGNSAPVSYRNGTVNGDVQIAGNSTLVTFTGNTVRGNLICRGNTPPANTTGTTAAGVNTCPA